MTKTLSASMVPVAEGTNLARNRIVLKWEEEWTTDDFMTETTLGDNTFYSYAEDDYGAGQHYVTRSYAYAYNGGALTINVLYHLRNRDISDENSAFDVDEDIKDVEELLSTLRVIVQNP